jgi:hypothetical protein
MELVPVLSGSLHVATAFCQKMFRGFLFWQVKQSRGKISKCTQCNIRTLPLCEQNSLKQIFLTQTNVKALPLYEQRLN